ncbi:MAG TPA: hypothetical protein VFJ73_03895 [Bacillales bacterium]|nr:hypothetical protein [Bacillales bacterium]
MRPLYNKYLLPRWLRRCRDGFEPFCLPLVCFQLIRTVLFPTTLDVILLALLIGLYICYSKRWI